MQIVLNVSVMTPRPSFLTSTTKGYEASALRQLEVGFSGAQGTRDDPFARFLHVSVLTDFLVFLIGNII